MDSFLKQITPPVGVPTGGFEALNKALNSSVTLILIAVGVAAFIMIIVSGIQMTVSAGNPKSVAAAKGRLTWAIIGLILALLSFVIISTFQFFFGVGGAWVPQPKGSPPATGVPGRGEVCNPSLPPNLACQGGLDCTDDPLGGGWTCQPSRLYPGIGQACDPSSSDPYVKFCAAGLECVLIPSGTTYWCQPRPTEPPCKKLGDICTIGSGLPCCSPSNCESGGGGLYKCQ